MINGLIKGQALNAQFAVRARIQGVALYTNDFTVLFIQQNAAGSMTARRRIMIGTSNGETVLFPSPFSGMIRLLVDAIEKLLIVCHRLSSLFTNTLIIETGEKSHFF